MFSAAQFGHLSTQPDGPYIAFTAVDLVPIRMRFLRVRHGYTQSRLAEIIGWSQQAYAKLERPGANLQLRTIQQVETAMDEDLLELA